MKIREPQGVHRSFITLFLISQSCCNEQKNKVEEKEQPTNHLWPIESVWNKSERWKENLCYASIHMQTVANDGGPAELALRREEKNKEISFSFLSFLERNEKYFFD